MQGKLAIQPTLKNLTKDVHLGLQLAYRGLLSAWTNEQVNKIAKTRAWGVAGVSIIVVILVTIFTAVVKGALWLASVAGFERVRSWQAILHPVTVLSWTVFGASCSSLFVLRCVFDLDGPLFAVMLSSTEASAVAQLRGKPTGSILSHLGRFSIRLVQHLTIALVCYVSIPFPAAGYFSIPLLAFISTGEITKQLELKNMTALHKTAVVGLAILATFQFPSIRSCGPTVILTLKIVTMLGRSVAGSAKYIGLAVVSMCMIFPLGSQLALAMVGLVFSVHMTTRGLLYPLTARIGRSAAEHIHKQCWAIELGFGLPFMLLLGIPVVGPFLFTYAVGAAGELASELLKQTDGPDAKRGG
jgi:hypothetical protein